MRLRIWIHVSLGAALEFVDYLKASAVTLHQRARAEPDPIKSLDLRMQADDRDEDAESIKQEIK
jgi:hypothetical protein